MRSTWTGRLGTGVLLAALAGSPASAAEAACTGVEHRALDFWIGDWEVRDAAGKTVGTSRVEPVLGGCVLLEAWTGADGYTGRAFHMFESATGRWQQRWVDSRGQLLEFTGLAEGGEVRYEGAWRDGRGVKTRMTFSPLPGGRVRQVWQQSKDGGTWRTDFDGTYEKHATAAR